jgi:hypothetical protein
MNVAVKSHISKPIMQREEKGEETLAEKEKREKKNIKEYEYNKKLLKNKIIGNYDEYITGINYVKKIREYNSIKASVYSLNLLKTFFKLILNEPRFKNEKKEPIQRKQLFFNQFKLIKDLNKKLQQENAIQQENDNVLNKSLSNKGGFLKFFSINKYSPTTLKTLKTINKEHNINTIEIFDDLSFFNEKGEREPYDAEGIVQGSERYYFTTEEIQENGFYDKNNLEFLRNLLKIEDFKYLINYCNKLLNDKNLMNEFNDFVQGTAPEPVAEPQPETLVETQPAPLVEPQQGLPKDTELQLQDTQAKPAEPEAEPEAEQQIVGGKRKNKKSKRKIPPKKSRKSKKSNKQQKRKTKSSKR